MTSMANIDRETVAGFGREWQSFDQSAVSSSELATLFGLYFKVFPWDALPEDAVGFDLGCGSGRWARLAAQRVGKLHCIDASDQALAVARRNLGESPNVEFHHASVDSIPLADGSMDFGYSLGVLHHVPDTAAAIRSCAAKVKPGAPLLLYLYYALDNRPWWYRLLWRASNLGRVVICRLPHALKCAVAWVIAAFVYWPLARLAWLVEKLGLAPKLIPLASYRKNSFYTMWTDALDRFGTRLEHRFTRAEIQTMMEAAGLERIEFSDDQPYWCAVGFRK